VGIFISFCCRGQVEKIYFAKGNGNNRDIYRINPDGSGLEPIIMWPGSEERFPQISPDGTKLAFESNISGVFQLWVSETDGSGAYQITNVVLGTCWDFSWYPDSQHFTFDEATASTDARVCRIGIDGTGVQVLVDHPGSCNYDILGQINPIDTVHLVYQNDHCWGPHANVFNLNLETNTEILILDGMTVNAPHGHYRWHPDGSKMVFMLGKGGLCDNFDICIMNGDGSNRHTITHVTGPDGYYHMDWSPDATQIVSSYFTSYCDDPHFLVIMDTNGGNIAEIYNDPIETVYHPCWAIVSEDTCQVADTLSVSIVVSSNPVCKGDTVCFTSIVEHAGEEPSFQWSVKGNLSDALVAWYPFDGNALDRSGNQLHGTVNGATLVTDRFGYQESAYHFNGISDNILVADDSLIRFDSSFTISLWIMMDSPYVTNTNVSPLAKPMGTEWKNSYVIYSGCWGGGDTLTNVGYYSSVAGEDIYSVFSLQQNTWHHLAWIMDRTWDTGYVYIDGTLTGKKSVSVGALFYDDHPLLFGSDISYGNPAEFFPGCIDDIRLYSRALNQAEIQSLFFEGDSVFCYVPESGDTVYCSVSAVDSCGVLQTDTSNCIVMTVDTMPSLILPDTSMSCSIPFELNAGPDYFSYVWNTGETTAVISVDQTGWYSCTITNGACSISDTLFLDLILPVITPGDTLLCSEAPLLLRVDVAGGPATCSKNSLYPSLQEGLVAYYPFCGNAYDASGNGYHGTTFGTIPSTDRFLTDTAAYDFSGAAEYIGLPSSIGINDHFSIGFWIKTTASCVAGFAGYMFIIDRDLCGAMPDWSIGLGEGGKIIFNTGTFWGENTLSTTRDVNDGLWHHILVVKDGNLNQKRIYIDGRLNAMAPFTGSFINQSEPIFLGASVCATSSHIFFDGVMDDVTIYDRALTLEEITYQQLRRNILWSTGETTPAITVLPQQDTVYWVAIGDSILTCFDTISVLLDPVMASIEGDTLFCDGDSSLLLGSGGLTFYWNTGCISDTLVICQPGDYWLEVTGEHGCKDTALMTVTMHPAPLVSLGLCIPETSRDARPFLLKGGLPLGGVFSGNGVHNGIFYPSEIPEGQPVVEIQYRYTNVFDCTDSLSQTLHVYPASGHVCGNPFTDVRDNQVYQTRMFGSACWMTRNLNYGTRIAIHLYQQDNCIPEKYCYNESPFNCTDAGGLYQWDELTQYNTADSVQGLCPPGWHIPSENEWQTLILLFQDAGLAGGSLKPSGSSGFDGLLTGFLANPDAYTYGENDTLLHSTMFWTSTGCGDGKAWAHGLNMVVFEPGYTPSVSSYPSSKANAFSVRCVKNW